MTRSRAVDPHSLLAPPKVWGEIDYQTNMAVDVEGAVEFAVSAPGVVHGLAVWFEAEIMPGIRYSTGPDNMPTVYGSAFLPLSRPLPVTNRDTVQVRLSCTDVGGEYYTRWRTQLTREGKQEAALDQGDFFSQPLTLDRLKRRLPESVPTLKPEGQLVRLVLEGAHAGRSMGQIASGLLEAAPGRFDGLNQAIDYAAQTLERNNG
jgi:protein arginine N-methyltransferase 1